MCFIECLLLGVSINRFHYIILPPNLTIDGLTSSVHVVLAINVSPLPLLPPYLQTPESVSHGVSEYRERWRHHRKSSHAPPVRRAGLHPPEWELRESLLVYLNHAGTYLPTSKCWFIHIGQEIVAVIVGFCNLFPPLEPGSEAAHVHSGWGEIMIK